jgi:hypothetical protein
MSGWYRVSDRRDVLAMPRDLDRSATELGELLQVLERERAMVLANAPAYDEHYVADLDDEQREVRKAYTVAAVTDIARFRSILRHAPGVAG